MKVSNFTAAAVLALCSGSAVAQDQDGLVNITVDGNTVQVPLGVAANVCDIEANVLTQDFAGTDDAACDIDQTTAAENNIEAPSAGDGGTDQEGLVNVAVEDNVVQVPVSVAANVCDVDVNVLSADYVGTEETVCEIDQQTAAQNDIQTGNGGDGTDQEGLVNVAVGNNVVQVPIGVAANVCDVEANVLSEDFVGSEETACTIDQATAAENNIEAPGAGEGSTDQEGLVNLLVDGNTVQVPLGVAANVCDLDVNVIASDFADTEDTACEIDQETAAANDIGTEGDDAATAEASTKEDVIDTVEETEATAAETVEGAAETIEGAADAATEAAGDAADQ